MTDLDGVFERLRRSAFRQKFRPRGGEREYLEGTGLETVMGHTADFIEKRPAPAYPANDSRQTPMCNNPVFVAQHATATCRRGCREQRHATPKGREMTAGERRYVIDAIRYRLCSQAEAAAGRGPCVQGMARTDAAR